MGKDEFGVAPLHCVFPSVPERPRGRKERRGRRRVGVVNALPARRAFFVCSPSPRPTPTLCDSRPPSPNGRFEGTVVLPAAQKKKLHFYNVLPTPRLLPRGMVGVSRFFDMRAGPSTRECSRSMGAVRIAVWLFPTWSNNGEIHTLEGPAPPWRPLQRPLPPKRISLSKCQRGPAPVTAPPSATEGRRVYENINRLPLFPRSGPCFIWPSIMRAPAGQRTSTWMAGRTGEGPFALFAAVGRLGAQIAGSRVRQRESPGPDPSLPAAAPCSSLVLFTSAGGRGPAGVPGCIVARTGLIPARKRPFEVFQSPRHPVRPGPASLGTPCWKKGSFPCRALWSSQKSLRVGGWPYRL